MEYEPLLPVDEQSISTGVRPSPKHLLKIALRIKQLIDIIVPIDFDPEVVTRADSPVITQSVITLVREAAAGLGDGEPGSSSRAYQATLVFILLTVRRWYESSAEEELHDANLYLLRASAAEQIGARLIEEERDERYLFRDVLCQRYSITLHGEDTKPANALEVAVDLHATTIIATAGYQRCRTWLWRGWIVQSGTDPDNYVFYTHAANTDFKTHFHPDRIKTPQYQNLILLVFSFIYLILYTLTINTLQRSGDFDWSEGLFFAFTLGFIVDEAVKLYHVGFLYIGFWNAFNDTLYALVAISFVFRAFALNHNPESPSRIDYLITAYRLLACCAPFIWCRLLLYLESLQFFGAMLVVLSQLVKESVIFFVLLLAVSAGFFQAFIGLDSSDGSVDFLSKTSELMFMTIMGNPAYDALDNLAHPYGQILYYLFAFLICTLLLNILVALFASAYDHIYDNATEEYLALLAEKTLRFVRAPDENVYVPPLNLFELVFSTLPFEWWLSDEKFQKLNEIYLTAIYSPVLIFTAYKECRTARRIHYNRMRGLADDANERDQEWDLMDGYNSPDEDSSDDEAVHVAILRHNKLHHRRSCSSSIRTGNGHNGGLARRITIRHDTSAELDQMNAAIEAGDPDFINGLDEKVWLKRVIKHAPQIELGDKSGAGWNNYWLVKEIQLLKEDLAELKRGSDSDSGKAGAIAGITGEDIAKIVSDAVKQALAEAQSASPLSTVAESKSIKEDPVVGAEPVAEPVVEPVAEPESEVTTGTTETVEPSLTEQLSTESLGSQTQTQTGSGGSTKKKSTNKRKNKGKKA